MSIFVDEDGGCMMGTRLPPPPGFVPPTIAKSLEEEFGEEVYFYDLNGRPVALFGLMDYAEDWSAYPIREVHPFYRGVPHDGEGDARARLRATRPFAFLENSG